MLKKIVVNLVIIICTVFLINNSYAIVPSIYIENAVKKDGSDEITVDLNIEDLDSSIYSLGLNISYDESKLKYISSKHGKNLKATVQMSEYIEKNSISVRIKGQDGLKNDGTYYQMKFKILNGDVEQIPVNLELKEAKDAKGNNVQCKVSSGIVYTKEQPATEDKKTNDNINGTNKSDTQSPKKENDKPVIKPFEKTEVKEQESLTDIVSSNIEPNTTIKKDNLKYEVKDKDIVEVLDNGNMIPKKDGITQIIVKQDNEEIGIMEVEVKDGQIKRITSQYKDPTNDVAENKVQTDEQEKEEKKSVVKKR